jgi:hypothetical protein
MKKEYRQRVFIVLLFFTSIAVIIGIGSLFPAYIYATFEEKYDLNQVANFKKSVDAAAITANQKQLNQSAGLISSLDQYAGKPIFYPVISSIVNSRGAVRITSMAVDHTTATTMAITIVGVAPTRSDLLAFKGQLMGIGSKTTVNLPLSTLAKGNDVPFSLQITTTLQ